MISLRRIAVNQTSKSEFLLSPQLLDFQQNIFGCCRAFGFLLFVFKQNWNESCQNKMD